MFRIIKKPEDRRGHGRSPAAAGGRLSRSVPKPLRRPHHSVAPLTIREVDTGSCNACEMEMNALANPVLRRGAVRGAYCRISSSCRCAGRNRSRDCEHGASL